MLVSRQGGLNNFAFLDGSKDTGSCHLYIVGDLPQAEWRISVGKLNSFSTTVTNAIFKTLYAKHTYLAQSSFIDNVLQTHVIIERERKKKDRLRLLSTII